jgi:formylglycine-generating enzyme required for sulfatase activity
LDTLGVNPENWPEGWNLIDANHALIACDWSLDGYRLPTEMEWMFASSGGTKSYSYIYSGSNDVDEVAWYQGNNNPIGAKEVATKSANELGIYDMSGNVWEWVWDIMDLYSPEAQTNPHGAEEGYYRGRRGGSWYGLGSYCRIEQRDHRAATFTSFDLGFRVARNYGNGSRAKL